MTAIASRQVLDYVESRPETVTDDLVSEFGLTHDAATKHLQRLYEAALVRRPQHGVYAPLISPVTDLYSSEE